MNQTSRALKIGMWTLFAGVVLVHSGMLAVMAFGRADALARMSSKSWVLLGELFFLLLVIAFLVRDALQGRTFARRILVSGLLGLSWLQLGFAKYGLSGVATGPEVMWFALAASVVDALLGSMAILCFARNEAAQTSGPRWNFTVGLLFIVSLGITAQLTWSAVRVGTSYASAAVGGPQRFSAEAEKRFLAGDPAITQDVETLLEIVRFGSTADVRAKASMELLEKHKGDPRAVLGLQIHAVEEFKRVEEAIGKR